jgi:predicted RND superfamily exporter protein
MKHRWAAIPWPSRSAFVDWTLRHGRLLWCIALLLGIPATWRTAQLYIHLNSNLEALLPREAPSVLALSELRQRMGGLQYLGVVVDTGDAEHLSDGERFIDDLAARIRTYPRDLVGAVRTGTGDERHFLETHAPLYVDLPDLETIRARIEARRDWEVGHETDMAIDEDTPPPPLDFSEIQKKYEDKLPKKSHEGDRYSSKDLHLTMLLIEVGGFETGTRLGRELLTRVQADAKALGGPQAYDPGMRMGYSGDVAISVEELHALIEDLALSSVLVLVAVVFVIVLYYRWPKSVLVLVPPLLLATVFAFAIGSLPPFSVTELNSNTAFLGAIIVGNGINFGIVLLARYMEERRQGYDLRSALITAVGSARVGTLSAALGASVAYGSLLTTQFRGFRQFGVIGGIGMVLSWALAFVLMPPLISWLDRSSTVAISARKETRLMARQAAFIQRFRIPVVLVGLVVTGLAIAKVRSFGLDQIEVDVSKLRRRDTWTTGEGYWGRQMDRLLGRYLTPVVMLTDSQDEANAVAARLRDPSGRPLMGDLISDIRTLDDVLPPQQTKKIAETTAIREDITPRMRALLAPEQRDLLDRLLGDEDPEPVSLGDLPRTFKIGLVERDGSAGHAVLVFPRFSRALWEGPPLVRFVTALRDVGRAAGPKPARVAGSLPISADILGSIRRDGIKASAIAFVGVLAVVLAMFRRQATTVYVALSLTVAVLWLGALMMTLGVRINFANFIAFPITFGVGVDYAVNVMSRYVQDQRSDMVKAVTATGSAVTLCSMTTIIGYSSLLVAQNRALFLFGLVAVLGELACLTTAVTLLPALVTFLDQRRGRQGAAVQPGE